MNSVSAGETNKSFPANSGRFAIGHCFQRARRLSSATAGYAPIRATDHGRLGEVLASGAEPAIVASNSIGGVIATQAAARHPPCVAALVYVTAFVPYDAQSELDLTHLPEGADDQVQANIIIEPPVATMPAAASRSALYGSCSETDAAWAISKQRPQPLGPFVAPVSIPAGTLHGIDRYYVLCAKDRAIPVALQRRMIAENAITNVIELDTDHTPHLSMTVALDEALQRFARHAAAGEVVLV